MNLNFRRLLPVFAIATGVALVTATSAFKEQPRTKSGDPAYIFEYNAPGGNDYSAPSVQNLDNWSNTATDPACNSLNVRACSLQVPASSVDSSGGTKKLDPSFTITTGGSSTVAYVASTSDGSAAVIENKSN